MDTFAECRPYWLYSTSKKGSVIDDNFKVKLFKNYLNTEVMSDLIDTDGIEDMIKGHVRNDIRAVSVKTPEKRKSMISFKGIF